MLWRMLGADPSDGGPPGRLAGIQAAGASADAREGVMSFLEKRPAVFPVKVSDGLPQIFPGWEPPEFS